MAENPDCLPATAIAARLALRAAEPFPLLTRMESI